MGQKNRRPFSFLGFNGTTRIPTEMFAKTAPDPQRTFDDVIFVIVENAMVSSPILH